MAPGTPWPARCAWSMHEPRADRLALLLRCDLRSFYGQPGFKRRVPRDGPAGLCPPPPSRHVLRRSSWRPRSRIAGRGGSMHPGHWGLAPLWVSSRRIRSRCLRRHTVGFPVPRGFFSFLLWSCMFVVHVGDASSCPLRSGV
jgi:hypothetical protein